MQNYFLILFIWDLTSKDIAFFEHLYLPLPSSFSHGSVNLLVISKNGASGDYPGCTDLAYQKAILDGADVIDCPVQISKDGIPFCLGSINLYDSTTVAQSSYSNRSRIIPQIKAGSGIFTFSLAWSEIQNLTRKFKLVAFYLFAFSIFCCTPFPIKHDFLNYFFPF